jgi:hypothetical protein
VLDSKQNYPTRFKEYEQSADVLILEKEGSGKKDVTVVYDFREKGIARRLEFEGTKQTSEWIAREVPQYKIGTYTVGDTGRPPYFVRLQAFDSSERIVLDQIMLPRTE